MPQFRFTIMLIALGALIALSSCSKSEYWVKGLTLPSGSSVVNQTETTSPDGTPAMSIPLMGDVDKMLMVGFNCSGGWSTVSAHIDGCMSRAGYSEGMNDLASMGGIMGGSSPELDMFKGMRMYTHPDSKYTVMLMDMQSMAGGVGAGEMSLPGVGDYMLQVMKFK